MSTGTDSPATLAELVAAQEPYVPPPAFYTRLAADTIGILEELGPHTAEEAEELIRTLMWAEAGGESEVLP